MQVNKASLRATIKQIQNYFAGREKLPAQANSNEGCSAFSANDLILTNLCNELSEKVNAQKLPSFGASMFKCNNNSTLLKRCCDCPNGANPFTTRNAARNAAEKSLKTWLLNAEKQLDSIENETENETVETIIVGKEGKMPIKYIR